MTTMCEKCGRSDNYKKIRTNFSKLHFSSLSHDIQYPVSLTYICNCGYTFTKPVDSDKYIKEALETDEDNG